MRKWVDCDSGLYLAAGEARTDAVTWEQSKKADRRQIRRTGKKKKREREQGGSEKIVSCHTVVRSFVRSWGDEDCRTGKSVGTVRSVASKASQPGWVGLTGEASKRGMVVNGRGYVLVFAES